MPRAVFRLVWLILTAVLLTATASAQAPVAADAHVVAGSTSNAGGQNRLNLNVSGGPKVPASDVYLRLDLSRLPAGATAASVSKATLKLFVSQAGTPGTFDVYRVTSAWQELTIVDGARPSLGLPVVTGIPVSQKDQYLLLDITAPVQEWLSGTPNHGIALFPSIGTSLSISLDSKETTGTSHDAEIQIDYTDQAVIDSIETVDQRVGQEILDRQNADVSTLAQANAYTNSAVDAEAQARQAADQSLATQIGAETVRAQSVEVAINTSLANYARLDVANVFSGTSQKINGNVAIGMHDVLPDSWLNVGGNVDVTAGTFITNHTFSDRDNLLAIHTGPGSAFHAQNAHINGRAGLFETTHASGTAPALEIRSAAPGPGLLARNTNAGGTAGTFLSEGKILSGVNLSGEVFSVSQTGIVSATGFVGDGSGLTNIAAATAATATHANTADTAATATNALALGGQPPASFATALSLASYQAQLSSAGIINASANPVDWTQLKNVPSGLADGTDDGGSVSPASSLKVALLKWYDAAAPNTITTGSQPTQIAFDGAHMWVTNETGSTVTKIRASDGAVIGTYATDPLPYGIAFDGANMWVACYGSNTVHKFRASDGVRIGVYPVGASPRGVVFDGTHIWVANHLGGTLTKIRANDGANLGAFPAGPAPLHMAFDGSHLWITSAVWQSGTGTLIKLRPTDGTIVGSYAIGQGNPITPAFDGTNVWVSEYNGGTVTKLRASDGANLGTFVAQPQATGVAFDGESIWVGSWGSNSVVKFRMDGTKVGTFPVGTRPNGIAFDGANIWVANNGGTVSKM